MYGQNISDTDSLIKENYLNLEFNDREANVYRILPIDRLVDLFSSKQNVLVKPVCWDDPFENFIMRSRIRLPGGEISALTSKDLFYGQCWSRNKASDAMWRIYSPKNDGIRIRTTIKKLFLSLANSSTQSPSLKCFIGGVNYLSSKRLTKYAQSAFANERLPQADDLAQTLLVKRPAFKHENEVRLLYFDVDDQNLGDLFRYELDPHQLIDQIMIDPRLSYSEYLKFRDEIVERTGYEGKIKGSSGFRVGKLALMA